MNQKLNNEQKRLVENNYGLIYSFIQSRGLKINDTEDWYGTAAIGLCKAALCFDESRGTNFSTFAYIIMDNEVRNVMKKTQGDILEIISLDDILHAGCRFSDDICCNEDSVFYPVYLHEAINIAIDSLSDKDRQVIKQIITSDNSKAKIASQFGLTCSQVSDIYEAFIGKIRKYFID